MTEPWIDSDGWAHLYATCETTSGRRVAMHTRVDPTIADDTPALTGCALDMLDHFSDDGDDAIADTLSTRWLTPLEYLAHRF